MNEVREDLEQSSIVIELDATMAQFAGAGTQAETLKALLLNYARELAEDLTLPVDIALEIKTAGDTGAMAGAEVGASEEVATQARVGATVDTIADEIADAINRVPTYVVRVNGKRCRAVFPTRVAEGASAVELARAIAQVIHQNRELFITMPLCERIQQRWLAEQSAIEPIGAPELQKLCALLVQRGFKIERTKEHLKNFEEISLIHRSMEYFFEVVVGNWDSISMTLYFSKVGYGKLTAAGDALTRAGASPAPTLLRMFERIQDALFRELGVMVPIISVREDETLGETELRIGLNDVRFPPFEVPQDQEMAMSTLEGLLLDFARSNAGALLVRDAITYYLSVLRKSFDALAQATLALFDEEQLTSIFRSLVDEGISIKDLRSVLEGLTTINGTIHADVTRDIVFPPATANFYPVAVGRTVTAVEDLGIDDFANGIRMSLKRYITSKYTQGDFTLYAFLPDSQVTERMKSVEAQPLNDEEYLQLMQGISHALESMPNKVTNPVIMADEVTRKNLRKQIEKEFPYLAVVGKFEFLQPIVKLELIAQISMMPGVSAS